MAEENFEKQRKFRYGWGRDVDSIIAQTGYLNEKKNLSIDLIVQSIEPTSQKSTQLSVIEPIAQKKGQPRSIS